MADYQKAIRKVLSHEGLTKKSLGYVNDPDDRGGETLAGIARNFWPKWKGWVIVDACKTKKNFPKNLLEDATLHTKIVLFYKTNFWDNIGGDRIINQDIAELLVDSAVNEGVKPAVKRAQSIVGLEETGIINDELIEKLCLLS